jgi:hypothetical protein
MRLGSERMNIAEGTNPLMIGHTCEGWELRVEIKFSLFRFPWHNNTTIEDSDLVQELRF